MNGVNEYTLTLDKNTANALGEGYKKNDILTIDGINTAINKMIETCQSNIQKYIEDFQGKLTQTEQAEQTEIRQGGNYNNLGDESTNDSKTKIKEYKKKLTTIKERYEQALKDDIKDYKNLCDLLTKDGGLLNNINISVQSLRKNSNKLSQKMGLNLDTLLDPDPFVENKKLFDNLIGMVNNTKKELLNTSVQQNSQNLPGIQGIQEGTQAKTVPKEEEKVKEGSRPLTEGFQKFLDNLNLEDDDNNEILELYRVSLLTSLRKINQAIIKSIKKDGSARTNTSSANSYIAKDFGWIDPVTGNSGEITTPGKWKPNGVG